MSDGTERKSLWIPWLFVAGFAVMLAANGIMILVAFDSWPGLSEREAYRAGLEHNRALAQIREQRELGWSVAAAFRPRDDKRRGALIVRLTGPGGGALEGAQVVARLRRPVGQDEELEIPLRPLGGGRFEGRVSFPSLGVWEASYRVTRGEEEVVAHQRLYVR